MGLELSKKEIDSIIKGVPEPPKKTISKEKRLEIPVLSKNKKIDPIITKKIWKSMISAFIDYEYRNFKKK